jgi:hypothetical protein
MSDHDLPERSAQYVSKMTDSRAWDSFQLRDNDVIVATPPKCGTTWMQSLVMSLIFGKPGMDVGLNDFSVWLDPGFRDQAAIAALFEAQDHRRCIKTHTPLDGITYEPTCTYIAVYRHPIDAHFSMRKHAANLKINVYDQRMLEAPSVSFGYFLEDVDANLIADGMTLSSIVHHYKAFKDWSHLPNVHLFHYADMRRDLPGQTARASSLLGYTHGPDLLNNIADSLRFEQVQTNARKALNHGAQSSATFKDPAAFFESASSGKWVGKLDDRDIELYRSRMKELLPAADAEWLENGGELPNT